MNPRRIGTGAVAVGLAGAVALAATAGARTPSITLKARTAGSLGKVLAAPNAHTLYRLTGERKSHLLCTSSTCLSFWKPLLVRSKSTKVKLPAGVSGTTGFVKRGKRFQVMLAGHPLYTFISDTQAGQATGQNIQTFGGTWLVTKVSTNKPASNPAPQPAPSPGYPPYY